MYKYFHWTYVHIKKASNLGITCTIDFYMQCVVIAPYFETDGGPLVSPLDRSLTDR